MVYKKYMLPSTPFAGSAEVYEWLSGFINYERALPPGKYGQASARSLPEFGLDRINALTDMAGRPEKCAPSFHIAGSKGKGSVTGMIAAILEASGKKTARYASPHVSDFRERLTIGNRFFSEDIYALAGNELARLSQTFLREGNENASFFELITLWFFLCARLSRCDFMAVETGLGGRLDATNILEPEASVITLIELEHTEYLGSTIAAIAGEKAGIIKRRKPLVLAEQNNEALEVFRKYTEEKESPLFYFPDCAELKDVRVERAGTQFTLVLKKRRSGRGTFSPPSEEETYPGLFTPIPGDVQAKNAGLAILALKVVCPEISDRDIRTGLEGFSLPARFERISGTPPVVIDGAHTKKSVAMCVKTFTSLYGGKGILVFGCAAGKDVVSMAELCAPCFSRIIITTPGVFKKSFPEEIYSVFKQAAERIDRPPELLFLPQTGEAIEKAVSTALKSGLPVLGTGSFYLAGEIRKAIIR
jgi:dihydrofolate synthase/folylpolyglutamate synthase